MAVAEHRLSKSPRLIAVIGTEASGKDTYAHHLEEMGYMHVSAGDFMRSEARARGYTDPISREVLSTVGDEVKALYGPSPITAGALAKYESQADKFPAGIVISGLRRPGELKAFKQQGAVVIWVDADIHRRFERQLHRDRGDAVALFAEFEARSRLEYYGDPRRGAESVCLRNVEALADCRVDNNGNEEEFIHAVDTLLGFVSPNLRP